MWDPSNVFVDRYVYYTVSLSRRVHYQRFYCLNSPHHISKFHTSTKQSSASLSMCNPLPVLAHVCALTWVCSGIQLILSPAELYSQQGMLPGYSIDGPAEYVLVQWAPNLKPANNVVYS